MGRLLCRRSLPRMSCITLSMAFRALRRTNMQGDNNWGDDRALYNEGQQWLNLNHLMGRVVG